MFVDTHCHLYNKYFADLENVINSAKQNYVNIYITATDNIASCEEMISLAEKNSNVYFCLGIHPENINENMDVLVKLVEENLNNNKFIAIGEIGLDYYYTKEYRYEQLKLFESQLALAERYNLPVVIHSREATKDTLDCLKKYKVKGVIHCFNGSLETAKEYIKLGFKLGVNGIITFKNCNLKDIIKKIGLENIVLETDCPYLTPEPFRKYQNEPKYIYNIAEFLAQLYDVTLDDVAKYTNRNVNDIFDINITI